MKQKIQGMYLCFAILFTIISFIFIFRIIKNQKYSNLLINGIQVEAEIIPGSQQSTTTIDDIPYFSMKFSYTDKNNITREGTTSESYTYEETLYLEEVKYILIKYDPKTFETVESSHEGLKESFNIVAILEISFLAIIPCIVWFFTIKNIRKNSSQKNINKENTNKEK